MSDQVFWVRDVPSLSTVLVGQLCRISPAGPASTKLIDQDERPSFLGSGCSFFVDSPCRPTLSNFTHRARIDKVDRPRWATKFSGSGRSFLVDSLGRPTL